MKIYTRQGDSGSTGLFGGLRVSKANLRVAAYGLVDELNAVLGWARAADLSVALDSVLSEIQEACFRLGAWMSAAPGQDPGVPPLNAEDVTGLEQTIDRLDESLPALTHFILPGGGESSARLHIARTVARRLERATVELSQAEPVSPAILGWLNRLSDLLFVLARAANAAAGIADVPWKPREES